MLAAHEEHDLDGAQLADLLDGGRLSMTLRGARRAVVEIAVHVGDAPVDGHPTLSAVISRKASSRWG